MGKKEGTGEMAKVSNMFIHESFIKTVNTGASL